MLAMQILADFKLIDNSSMETACLIACEIGTSIALALVATALGSLISLPLALTLAGANCATFFATMFFLEN